MIVPETNKDHTEFGPLMNSGHKWLGTIKLPCGGTAQWNNDRWGYNCEDCLCVVGSVAQPSECVEAMEKYQVLRELGSRARWDYKQGREVMIK